MEDKIREEDLKILKWASESDMEFFMKYFENATEKELGEFLLEFPEFLNKKE